MFVVMEPVCLRQDVDRLLAAVPGMDAIGRLGAGRQRCVIGVHPFPARAWSDGTQALDLVEFRVLLSGLRGLAAACGRVQ